MHCCNRHVYFCCNRSVQINGVNWHSRIPEVQVKGLCVCVGGATAGLTALWVSPFFWQLDESHVAEAEVDQVLQQLLSDLVLNGLMEKNAHPS